MRYQSSTFLSNLVGTINLNPGRPALDAADLDALCELYLQESARRVSPVTLAGYSYALGIFRRWWAAVGPTLNWLLTRQELQTFAAWLESTLSTQSGQPLTYQTRRLVLNRLRQVFAYAHQHDYIERNYAHWVPAPTGQDQPRTLLQVDLLAALLHAAATLRKPARNQAILAVLIGTGMRRAECAQLDVPDVQFDARGGGQIFIRRGKGGKARTVVFNERTAGFLTTYLVQLRRTEGPLWTNQNGTRLTVKGLYDVVKKAAARAGLAEAIQGPHDLRRLFATTWNRTQKGLGYAKPLSLQLGHETAEMTLHYILEDVEDIREVFVSPFDLMDDEELFRFKGGS